MITSEQVREIASNAAEAAAEKAIRATLIALGVDVNKLHEEQKVWAFARNMQQGTQRGILALVTGFFSTTAAIIAGGVWYLFINKPHP